MSIVGLCQCVTHQDYIQYCNECLCKSKAVAAGGAYLQTFDPPWLFAVAVSPFRPTLEIYNMDQHGHQTAQSWKENPFPIIMMAVTVQFARNSFETTSLPGGIKLWDWGFTDSLCKWYFDYLWQFQLILYTYIYMSDDQMCPKQGSNNFALWMSGFAVVFFQNPSADGFGLLAKAVELLAVLELEHLEADSISYTTATWNHQMTGMLSRISKWLVLGRNSTIMYYPYRRQI